MLFHLTAMRLPVRLVAAALVITLRTGVGIQQALLDLQVVMIPYRCQTLLLNALTHLFPTTSIDRLLLLVVIRLALPLQVLSNLFPKQEHKRYQQCIPILPPKEFLGKTMN